MIDSKFLRLSIKDIINGLVVAVGSAIVLAIQAWFTNPNFSIFALSWSDGKVLLNIGMVAGISYLGKKFFSTSDGKFFGRI